jgi:hypothetical protein
MDKIQQTGQTWAEFSTLHIGLNVYAMRQIHNTKLSNIFVQAGERTRDFLVALFIFSHITAELQRLP